MGRSRAAYRGDGNGLGLIHADKSMIIAALPSPDDPVQKISSEPAAHLTILYLGNPGWDQSQLDMVTQFVEHAASLISQFHLDVESRGVLGDKNADVLFFDKNWTKKIETFRSQLLKNDLIAEAYLSTDQFPEWTPHLTLGYPASPAKKLDGYERIYGVNFDRIALYTGNYTGPTFQLKLQSYDLEVAMSQTQRGRAFLMGDGISHYGVKGMHWGVRKDRSGGSSAPAAKPAPKPRMSEDAKAVEKAFGKINRGGTDALSNQELQHLVNRLNLEQQYSRLTSEPNSQQANALKQGQGLINTALGLGKTYNDVHKFLKSPAGKAIKAGFKAAKVGIKIYTKGPTGAAVDLIRPKNHFTNTGR